MQYGKLFDLLGRADVKELALQSDRPPCALVGEQYKPITGRAFPEDEVIAVLVEAGGRTEVLQLLNGHRRWDFDHPALGKLRVSAGYHGPLLQARIKRAESATSTATLAKVAVPTATDDARAAASAPQPAGVARSTQARGDMPVSKARSEAMDFGDLPPLMSQAAAQPERQSPMRDSPPPEPASSRARAALDDAATQSSPEDIFAELAGTLPTAMPLELSAPPAREPAPPQRSPVRVEAGQNAAEATFDALLQLARTKRATDLHIVADRPPTLRIAGELLPQGPALPAALVESMILPRIPDKARADLDEHGACDFALLHPTLGRFRSNATHQRTGMKLTARPISERIPTLEELGLPESITLATHHHQGLIVVTGPTGHGKTTTLAAIVDIINRERTHHIITVEDPVEYIHPRKLAMISQREVGTHTKTFAAALKGSLREDPDVIVVGELRDTETVRMALSASETGHLVISTMNTPSAAKAIERIIDLFPPGDQPQVRLSLAGGLRLVVSQRLLPTADRQSLVAAAELLPGTPALWALIRDNKTFQIPSLQQRGKALGIIRLDDSLADLVRKGLTTLEIAREYAEAPEAFEALVQGRPARPGDQVVTAANIDPTREAKEAAQKFGKDMLSKAGKIFGNEKK